MKRELSLTDIAGYLEHPLLGQHPSGNICWIDVEFVAKYGIALAGYKPVLRPMSDLNREITHKGETFIPIECIAEMTREDGKDSNWTHDLINWFGEYDPIWNTYELLRALPEWLTIPVIDKICEWMFDYRGLIDAGLAVSVHDLKRNLYEAANN